MVVLFSKAVIRHFCDFNSYKLTCPYTVRRNASMCSHRLFSSNRISNKSSDRKQKLVQTLLKEYGFDDSQISHVSRKCPSIYSFSPHATLQPKLNFFVSIGLKGSALSRYLSQSPSFLSSCLKKQIIPCYNFLKNVTKEKPIRMLKHNPNLLSTKVDTVLAPNIEVLRSSMPENWVSFLVAYYTLSICRNHQRFKKFVRRAIELEIDPSSKTFVLAVLVLCEVNEKAWDKKLKLFERFGLSNDDVMSAFRKQPFFMATPDDKIVKCMEIFVNEVGWAPEIVSQNPNILIFYLEKRIVPRCRVIRMLIEKGLVMRVEPLVVLNPTDEQFVSRFIDRYKDDLPELMDFSSTKSNDGTNRGSRGRVDYSSTDNNSKYPV